MRDKRPVDELSIEELERVLAIKRREDRQQKLDRMKRAGRTVSDNNGVKQHPPQEAILAAPAVPSSQSPAVEAKAPTNTDSAPRFEDALDDIPNVDPERDRFWKAFVNQALLLVEVLAVAGLIYLGYTLIQSIGRLEQETASAQQLADEQRIAALPTIAPTPQLRLEQVVLPGGHTPPTSPGGPQFNLNEIPSNLLPVVQSQLFQPPVSRAPRTDETALRLIIPKLELDSSIVQGTDWEALKQGVGQLQNGVDPTDDQGNVVFSAHNDIYGELFRYLDQLEAGDRLQVQTQTKIFTYEVTGWDVHEPTDVHVLDARAGATLTLISCYPYQVDDKRIVVFANRVDT
jgi:sortase A